MPNPGGEPLCLVYSSVLSVQFVSEDSNSRLPTHQVSRLELGQVQEREAYSASDSSALEQVQERVADLASDPSVLEASSQYCVAQPVRTL